MKTVIMDSFVFIVVYTSKKCHKKATPGFLWILSSPLQKYCLRSSVIKSLYLETSQVLSGRVLDSRACGFEPHKRHCLVAASKTPYPLLRTGSTHEDPT